MRFLPGGLGAKLNLSLLVFLLLLGAATAGLVVYGFNRTQSNATKQSRAGLETQGRESLRMAAENNAGIGQLIVTQATIKGRDAAFFMANAASTNVAPIPDLSKLARGPNGEAYDASPERATDLFVASGTSLDANIARDVRDSAGLDSLLPAFISTDTGSPFEGQTVAVYFRSPSGVTRYFPKIDLAGKVPPEITAGARSAFDTVGPDKNPQHATIWTPPYTDAAGQGQLVTAYTPVYINDEYRGVIGVDLSLADLLASADSIHVTPNSIAFVIDKTGRLLPSRAQDTVQRAIDDPSNTEIGRIVASMRHGDAGFGRATMDGRETFVAYSPLGDFGGSLGLAAPVDEVTAQAAAVNSSISKEANRTVGLTLVLIAGSFIVAIASSAYLNRRVLLRPINALVSGTRAVAAGDLDATIASDSSDELGLLAQSFNYMTSEIRRRRDELGEREEQYRGIFESTSDGLTITTLEGKIVEANRAACEMHGYTYEEFLALPPGAHIAPEFRNRRDEYLAEVRDHGRYQSRSRDIRKDGSEFDVDILGVAFVYHGEPHILGVRRDVTGKVTAERMLEQSARLSAFTADIGVALTEALTLDEALARSAQAFVRRLGAVGAAVWTADGDAGGLRLRARAGPVDFAADGSAGIGQTVIERVARDRQPFHSDALAVETDIPGGSAAREHGAVAFAAYPLIVEQELAGVLALFSTDPLADALLESVRSAAGAIAIAIRRDQAERDVRDARDLLEQRVVERTRELSALLEVSQGVASTLDLRELVAVILRHVDDALESTGSAVITVDDAGQAMILGSSTTAWLATQYGPQFRFPIRNFGAIWASMQARQHVIIEDVRGDEPAALAYRAAVGPSLDVQLGGVQSWLGVPLAIQDRVIGMLAVTRNERGFYTERHAQLASAIASQAAVAIENARLYQQTEERTRELSTLLDASRSVASTLELEPLLHRILDQVQHVAPYDRAALLTLDGTVLTVAAAIAVPGQAPAIGQVGMTLDAATEPLLWERIGNGRPIIIDDVRADEPLASAYRRIIGPMIGAVLERIRSWMAAPLTLENRVIGIVILSRLEVGFYNERHAALATAVGTQAAVAIENARLYEQAEQRTRELATLVDVTRNVASTLELRPLLNLILDQVRAVADFDRAAFMLVEDGMLRVQAVQVPAGGAQEEIDVQFGMAYSVDSALLWDEIRENRPVLIDDVRADTRHARAYRRAVGQAIDTLFKDIRSWLGVPVALKDRVIGMMVLAYGTPGFYTERHAELAMAIASQAAVAVENARLYEQTEQRTRELATLLDVSHTVASTLDRSQLVSLILDQLKFVIDYTGSSILLLEGDDLVLLDSRGPTPSGREDDAIGLRFPLSAASALTDEIRAGRSVIIADARSDEPEAVAYREMLGADIESPAFRYVRSWAGVPLIANDSVVGMLSISRDEPNYFTEDHAKLARAVADQAAIAVENARLFAETQQRAREMSALLDISQGIASTLEEGPLIAAILERLRGIVDYTGASILRFEGTSVRVLDFNRYQLRADGTERQPIVFPREMTPLFWDALERQGVVLAADIRDGKIGSSEFARVTGPLFETAFRRMRSFLAVPLLLGDRYIGALTVSHETPGFFTQDQARLVRAVGDQAAVALENSRLFAETQRRAREMEALFRADTELFRSLSVDAVFQALCDVAVEMLGADKSLVTTVDDDEGRYTVRASRNIPQGSLDRMLDIRRSQPRVVLASLEEPLVNEDARVANPVMLPVFEADGIVSTVDVPIRSAGGVRGWFGLAYTRKHAASADETRLFQALADRAAVAIDNAALYERAQQAASLEERQRLARELHDSVSQALYGIALGARTAKTLLQRDPSKAAEPVDYVLSLAEAGLTEMRALIFELRPESLETEGLVAALQKQIAATQARYGIDVTSTMCDEPEVPLDVKEAVYRITQEALHNVVKHARATEASVTLACTASAIDVAVSDNGGGFDTSGTFPGHIGLRSMRERAAKIGGTIEIESAPGSGTTVRARLRISSRG